MNEKRFIPANLDKLNNPQKLIDIPPAYIWDKLNIELTDVIVEVGAGTALDGHFLTKKVKIHHMGDWCEL
ncbi:MAG: hypothetical protein GY714_11375 [Desulfobacterales bacterium]|nr:hypothetical protein [Desulfobacterales bacterium]